MTLSAKNTKPSTSRSSPETAAAFQGALRAFSKASVTQKPLSWSPRNGEKGALAAASHVGSHRDQQTRVTGTWIPRLDQGEDVKAVRNDRHALSSASSPLASQENARQVGQSREQSPSHMAALLATSSTSSPLAASKPNSRRPSPLQRTNTDHQAILRDEPSPTAAIRPLVQHGETKQASTPAPIVHSVRYVTKSTARVVSPTPIRPPVKPPALVDNPTIALPTPALPEIGSKKKADARQTLHGGAFIAVNTAAGPSMAGENENLETHGSNRSVPPPPPLRRRRSIPSNPAGQSGALKIQKRPPCSPVTSPAVAQSKPKLVAPISKAFSTHSRTPSALSMPPSRSISLNDPASLSSLSISRPQLSTSKSFDASSQSVQYARRSGEISRSSSNYFPQMSVDSLANAMVASSLASSRAPSPTKPVPPLPRRHGKHSLFHRNQSQDLVSRTPSPAKGMKQTMREPAKSDMDAEAEYKKKGHFARKHPNKHHEGDRKRYRTQVTERERKRYEGVWAANRGLYSPVEKADGVLNIVVRDIWSRSRLPEDVLEEVWDLVSLQKSNSLGRDEFVVGMWLIDQRLKGNKLPYKVSESVWSSVRRLSGIKVPKNRR